MATTNERTTAVGLFQNRDDAECAVRRLKDLGLDESNIGFALRDEANTIATTTTDKDAGEGAVEGAVAGGVLGAILGAAAALLIPGIGPIVAGGILAAALGGAAVGAVAGGLIGALTELGVPEEEARYYDEEFKSGRIVVTAQAGSYYDQATQILRDCGAYSVNAQTVTMGTQAAGAAVMAGQDSESLKLREEQLDVHKDRVQTGEVVIKKKVVTENKTVEVPVTREEVTVERRSVNQPSTGEIMDDETEIRVPVMEDQVTVDKHQVVREEIRVNKTAVQGSQQVSGEVRREEAEIQEKGNVDVRQDNINKNK